MKKLVLANLKMYFNITKDVQDYLNNLNDEKENFIAFPPIIYK